MDYLYSILQFWKCVKDEFFNSLDIRQEGDLVRPFFPHKPFAFLDFEGYYQPLKAMLEKMVEEGFVWKEWVEKVPFLADIAAVERFITNKR